MAKDDIITFDLSEDEELEYGTKEYWEKEKENEKKREQYFGDEIKELEPSIDPYDKPDLSSEFGDIKTDEGDVVDISDVEDDSWWLPDLWDAGSDLIGSGYDYLSDYAEDKGIRGIASDTYEVGQDLLSSQINAILGSPEMLWNVAKLPYEGAKDFAKGDFLGMGGNILDVMHTRNPLKYNKEDPWSLYEFAEWPAGIWAAKKIQNALQSSLPTKAANIYKNLYPYWSSFADPAKKGIKQMTWPAIRGLGQYGLASTGIGALIPALAYAGTPTSGAGQSELDWERENMANINSMINAGGAAGGPIPDYYQDPIIQTAKRNEDPGPRNNYQGL